jgi:hypothetical protein
MYAGDLRTAYKCGNGHYSDYYHGDCFLTYDKAVFCECGTEKKIVSVTVADTFRRIGRIETEEYLNGCLGRQIDGMLRELRMTKPQGGKAAGIRKILWELFDAVDQLNRIVNYAGE